MNQISNRKYYIDNLRAITILFLFPFHIFMIYNNWGEGFYVHGQDLLIPSIFNIICSVWMMPLLFAIAGMSSRYALERRNTGEYAKERVNKLLVPLIFGMLLVISIQPYIAGLYHNGEANFFDYFKFTDDLSGYNGGGWTPANLWFLLFLFGISLICLPFMLLYKKKGKGIFGDRTPLIVIILMGLIPCLVSNQEFKKVFEIGGKNILEYLTYFVLGYFFLSSENVLKKLDKYRFVLLGLFAGYFAIVVFVLDGEFYEAASWLGILALLGIFRHYLNFTGKVTGYLTKSSFGVYIFHQSWIVVAAFFIFKFTSIPAVQIPLIFLTAVPLTYLTYEICHRVPGLRWMFGLKKPVKSQVIKVNEKAGEQEQNMRQISTETNSEKTESDGLNEKIIFK
ncbi:MAG: acyltransferase [Firmicutes bacterium]|nr:acyltransferase [Bacillota bacterium]